MSLFISNEYLIQQHIRIDKPTVLISPSMNTGVDLPDDLARFQIIVKMPYGTLGNKRIKEKSKIDNTWYQVDMIRNFIQSCGRGVRSEDDYCVTYVLDSSFYYCIKQNLKYISQIKERIILDKDKFNYDEFQTYLKGK
jgi:Rad3-related DNA helicase